MRFKLNEFLNYGVIEASILYINESSDVLLLDLDETLVSHKSYVYDRILKYIETLSGSEWTPKFSEKLFERIEFEGTDGVLNFVANQLTESAGVDTLLAFLRTDLGLPSGFFRPGAKETISKLNENFILKICTNGNERQQAIKVDYLNEMLGFKIPTYYCAAIASKPSPLCLIRALGDTSPDHALFVGDSETDYLAAVRAGIKFLNVSNLTLKT